MQLFNSQNFQAINSLPWSFEFFFVFISISFLLLLFHFIIYIGCNGMKLSPWKLLLLLLLYITNTNYMDSLYIHKCLLHCWLWSKSVGNKNNRQYQNLVSIHITNSSLVYKQHLFCFLCISLIHFMDDEKKISNLLIHWDRIVVGLVELFFSGSKTIVIKILKQEKNFKKIFP